LTEIRAGGRPTTPEAGGEHRSHHSSHPSRADPSRDPEDALADLLSLFYDWENVCCFSGGSAGLGLDDVMTDRIWFEILC